MISDEERLEAFISDVAEVWRKHRLALSPSDCGFDVVPFSPGLVSWLEESVMRHDAKTIGPSGEPMFWRDEDEEVTR